MRYGGELLRVVAWKISPKRQRLCGSPPRPAVGAPGGNDLEIIECPHCGVRREAPAQYESYVDLIPGEWTTMRIEEQGTTAKLFVGGAPQPTLIVNDLKRGADAHGSVGLYVDNGTDGHFRNLRFRLTS
jgi:hypothetical protein